MAAKYQTIENDSHEGDIILQSQKLATSQGFANVSKSWFEKTIPIATEIERLEQTRFERESMTVKFDRMRPVISNGVFGLELRAGGRSRELYPDKYALRQLGSRIGIGSDYPVRVLSFSNGHHALFNAVNHAWHELPEESGALLRLDNDNQLRAVLPQSYRWLRNDWYPRVLERAVSGGRLCHWRGDDYTIYGNLLIPDSIRKDADSEYGAMVSLSTCEIGKCGFRQQPSLFRAICMNGCIWGQEQGKAFAVKRCPTMDTVDLEKAIRENIHTQIPIAKRALEQFLATRSFSTNTPMKPVFAQVAQQFRLSRRLASAILAAWWYEKRAVPDMANTLFAVVNAVTRAGQTLSNDAWVRFDQLGGSLAQLKRDEWDTLVLQARTLRTKQVAGAFAKWSLSA